MPLSLDSDRRGRSKKRLLVVVKSDMRADGLTTKDAEDQAVWIGSSASLFQIISSRLRLRLLFDC